MTQEEAKKCMIEQIVSMKKSGRRTTRDMEMEITGMMIAFHKMNVFADDEYLKVLESMLNLV